MTKREGETRKLLFEAATRLPHGYAYVRGRSCPAPTCFRCAVMRFLRKGPRGGSHG